MSLSKSRRKRIIPKIYLVRNFRTFSILFVHIMAALISSKGHCRINDYPPDNMDPLIDVPDSTTS